MILLNIPFLMVVCFLLLTLGVGLSFKNRTTTLREYAVGNRDFKTGTLVVAVLASNYGGSGFIRTVECVYSDGLYWIIFLLLSYLFFFRLINLSWRMGPFMEHLSMPESIGWVYGKKPRMVSALVCLCSCIIVLASQISVMLRVIHSCLGLDNPYITVLIIAMAMLIIVVYSLCGGIRSVTFTDILQFITFSLIIPFIAWIMLRNMYKSGINIFSSLQTHAKFQFNNVFRFDVKLIAIMMLCLSNLMGYIGPVTMQRFYMASGAIQVRKVTIYAVIFGMAIRAFMILIGVFVFIGSHGLSASEVWLHVMNNIPIFFKGLVSIGLLAMIMSTADSCLHTCSVLISHDLIGSWRKTSSLPYFSQLQIARYATLMIGILAIVVAFYCSDLLGLRLLSFDLFVPIVSAPFILATLGFRGTSRTALVGMAVGVITMLSWLKWITPLEPEIGINGAFPCMLANGLAMIGEYYLLPQPKGVGWVKSDDDLRQIYQAKKRKSIRRTESLKTIRKNLKGYLIRFKPTEVSLIGIGVYSIVSTLLMLNLKTPMGHLIGWIMVQLILGTFFLGWGIFISSYKFQGRMASCSWLGGLLIGLPVNIFLHWWYTENALIALSVTTLHLLMLLWVLPLYLDITVVIVTLWLAIWIGWARAIPIEFLNKEMLSIGGVGISMLSIVLYDKFMIAKYLNQIDYLINQQKIRDGQKRKQGSFRLNINHNNPEGGLALGSSVLEQVIKGVTKSISFLDTPLLYKQDFQSILNKFSQWVVFLKQQAKSSEHILLLPTRIGLEDLIHKLELSLEKEIGRVPRLLIEYVEKQNRSFPGYILCDVQQIICLLVTAILRVINLNQLDVRLVKIALHPTFLCYGQDEQVEEDSTSLPLTFPALAMAISHSDMDPLEIPKVEKRYFYISDKNNEEEGLVVDLLGAHIDLGKKIMERIIHSHYGYLQVQGKQHILLVLPLDVAMIREEMISKLPIDLLTTETPITSREEGESMFTLMEFHDYICQVSYVEPVVISKILLLLRRCYGFKRHACGELFYIRAIGIARLAATWLFHSPKPIYAALLYDLVRYTCLPISYIKANYDLGIFCFVENILNVDKHQKMEASLLYIGNRFKEAASQEQLSVLYIKLAERIYDLLHAEGYSNMEELKYMIKETFAVDVGLAQKYLESEIAIKLESSAKQALEIYKKKSDIGLQ